LAAGRLLRRRRIASPASRPPPCASAIDQRERGHRSGLVDDRENHRQLWEDAGGIFIHHRNARDTIRQLAEIYPSVKVPA
jgi:hypothetical protein